MGLNPKGIRQIQEQLLRVQDELANKTVEGTAGGGMVRVVMNGHQELKEITIAPEVVDPADIALLQDMIMAAVNQAVALSHELADRGMGSLLGGLGIRGF